MRPKEAECPVRLQCSTNFRLTDLDLARHRARLKEIDNLLNSDATIAQATEQLAAAEKALKPWQTRARDLELEIKSVVEKIQSTDADLYSGRITNPKALQELQSEIESLKRHQSQLEDSQLEAMLEVEDLQAQMAAAQQQLTDARAALASQQTDLIAEQTTPSGRSRQNRTAARTFSLRHRAESRRHLREAAPAFSRSGGRCAERRRLLDVRGRSDLDAHQQMRSGRTLVLCESCGRILAETS